MRQQNPVVGKGEGVSSFVHIYDAATGTVAALAAEPGVYTLLDDDPSPQTVWLPAFAKFVGAPVPPHMSEAEATAISAGGVYLPPIVRCQVSGPRRPTPQASAPDH